jgi:hypothetical protein
VEPMPIETVAWMPVDCLRTFDAWNTNSTPTSGMGRRHSIRPCWVRVYSTGGCT